jgi:hypothetical protein
MDTLHMVFDVFCSNLQTNLELSPTDVAKLSTVSKDFKNHVHNSSLLSSTSVNVFKPICLVQVVRNVDMPMRCLCILSKLLDSTAVYNISWMKHDDIFTKAKHHPDETTEFLRCLLIYFYKNNSVYSQTIEKWLKLYLQSVVKTKCHIAVTYPVKYFAMHKILRGKATPYEISRVIAKCSKVITYDYELPDVQVVHNLEDFYNSLSSWIYIYENSNYYLHNNNNLICYIMIFVENFINRIDIKLMNGGILAKIYERAYTFTRFPSDIFIDCKVKEVSRRIVRLLYSHKSHWWAYYTPIFLVS